MLYENVQNAIKEAERFIKAAKKVKKDDTYWHGDCGQGSVNAATKRASLDLTMALVKMRRPQ